MAILQSGLFKVMSGKAKRSYNADARQAKAKQTRQRILDASKSLFELEGFELVTIEKMAQAAAVSAPTIYLLFKSKRGVLKAILDDVLLTDEFTALRKQRLSETSPKKRLVLTAKLCRSVFDAESSQINLFRGASVLSPELKELEQEREERRYALQEELVAKMAEERSLAKGLNLTKARDILWTLTARDLYRMCVLDRGWTSDEYEAWLADVLIKVLARDDLV